VPLGEKRCNSKLKTEQVLDIREQVARGVTQKTMAKKYKMSRPAVNAIVNYRTWRHV